MQNTNLLHAGMLPGFSRAVITVFISHRFDDHSGRLSVRSPCCNNEIRQYIFLLALLQIVGGDKLIIPFC